MVNWKLEWKNGLKCDNRVGQGNHSHRSAYDFSGVTTQGHDISIVDNALRPCY